MKEKSLIKAVLKWLTACLLILACVMAVRYFCVASYKVSTDSMEGTLQWGDYIFVNKLEQKGNPGRDRIVLFTSPLQKDRLDPPLFLSRCIGMPGDTISVTREGFRINGRLIANTSGRLRSGDKKEEEYKLIIPEKNTPYRLNAVSLSVCREAISQEIGDRAVFRDGKLYIDGRESSFFIFRQDYYWMLSDNPDEAIDSRHLGFIPSGHVLGNVWFCWYSKDKERLLKPVY